MTPTQLQLVTLFPKNTDNNGCSWINTKPNNSPLNIPSSNEPALQESKIKRVAYQIFLQPFNLPKAAQTLPFNKLNMQPVKEEPQRLICRLDDPNKHYHLF